MKCNMSTNINTRFGIQTSIPLIFWGITKEDTTNRTRCKFMRDLSRQIGKWCITKNPKKFIIRNYVKKLFIGWNNMWRKQPIDGINSIKCCINRKFKLNIRLCQNSSYHFNNVPMFAFSDPIWLRSVRTWLSKRNAAISKMWKHSFFRKFTTSITLKTFYSSVE